MIENLPDYISIVFILTTFFTIWFFYKAANKSICSLAIISVWLLFQALMAWKGFYIITNTIPPRFALLVAPPLLLIVLLFITGSGRKYIDALDIKLLTLLHVIRIPVEIGLLWLFLHKKVPGLMTFEGRNFDILSGLTAPIIFYLGFVRKILSNKTLLAWNFICIGLLINIVVNAILSAPFPFQKFAFDQPNIALLYFPFVWLPCCIVPLVLLAHLASIRQLLLKPGNPSA